MTTFKKLILSATVITSLGLSGAAMAYGFGHGHGQGPCMTGNVMGVPAMALQQNQVPPCVNMTPEMRQALRANRAARVDYAKAQYQMFGQQLGIQANQQKDWNNFVEAKLDLMKDRMKVYDKPALTPEERMDRQADRAQDRAKGLRKLSKAYSKLDKTLTPEQRQQMQLMSQSRNGYRMNGNLKYRGAGPVMPMGQGQGMGRAMGQGM